MVKIYSNLQYNSPCNKTLSFCLCLALMEKTSILLLIFFFFWCGWCSEKKENKGKMRYLLGESMGGALALLLHRNKPYYWDGAVLVAPMCKVCAFIGLFFLSCLLLLQSFLSRSFWRVLNAIYDPIDMWLYFVQTFLNSFVLLHYEWHISYLH